MNEDESISPSTIREWVKNPAYIAAVNRGIEQWQEQPLDVGALLIGIRFLHDFVKTQEGKLVVKRALDEGFVELVSDGNDEANRYAIPHLLWLDRFYDDLCPSKGKDVSFGIQIARYMLWGPPGLHESCLRGGLPSSWDAGIREALCRFEGELGQRRQQLAEAIRGAARELAARGEPGCGNKNGLVAISSAEIFELIRLTIPDVTHAEVMETIWQTLPYMGGPRH
jgi:hypothetical protein